jgi:hypothetical protein
MTTATESRYLGRIASLRCVLCSHLGQIQEGRTFVHHVKEGAGIAQRSQHWLACALCYGCHQGPNGLHGLGTKGFATRYKMDELDLLALTIKALNS